MFDVWPVDRYLRMLSWLAFQLLKAFDTYKDNFI